MVQINPTKHPQIFTVSLNLGFENRFIGKLNTANSGTFAAKRTENHIHRKTNSFGINLELLNDKSIQFKWIVLRLKKHDGSIQDFTTTRDYYLKHGKKFTFGKAGFEQQIFLPLPEFDYERALRFEQSQGIQQSLFSEKEVANG